jgi:hypothetical protein
MGKPAFRDVIVRVLLTGMLLAILLELAHYGPAPDEPAGRLAIAVTPAREVMQPVRWSGLVIDSVR